MIDPHIMLNRARGWNHRAAAEGEPVLGRVVFTAPLPLVPVAVTAVVEPFYASDHASEQATTVSYRVDLVRISLGSEDINVAILARICGVQPDDVRAILRRVALVTWETDRA